MDEPETSPKRTGIFASWLAFVLAAAGAVVALWFLQKIVIAILLLFFAAVVAIALSAPVEWFVRRGLSRRLAGPLTLFLFFGAIILLAALVIPQLATQIALLVNQLPAFIVRIDGQLAALLERYPELHVEHGSVRERGWRAADQVLQGLAASRWAARRHCAGDHLFSTVAYIVLDPADLRLSRQPAASRWRPACAPIAARPYGDWLDQGEPGDQASGVRRVRLPLHDARAGALVGR